MLLRIGQRRGRHIRSRRGRLRGSLHERWEAAMARVSTASSPSPDADGAELEGRAAPPQAHERPHTHRARKRLAQDLSYQRRRAEGRGGGGEAGSFQGPGTHPGAHPRHGSPGSNRNSSRGDSRGRGRGAPPDMWHHQTGERESHQRGGGGSAHARAGQRGPNAGNAEVFASLKDQIKALGRQMKGRELTALLDSRTRSMGLSVKEYGAAIAAFGRCGEWRRSLSLLRELTAIPGGSNVWAYTAAMDACGRSGRLKEMGELLQTMREKGGALEPTSISYTCALNAYGKAGMLEQALELFEEMKAAGAGRSGAQGDSGGAQGGRGGAQGDMLCNLVTYNCVIAACAKTGHADKALHYLREIQEVGLTPDTYSYGGAISACAKARGPEEQQEQQQHRRAGDLLEEMKQMGLRPSVIHYTAAMQAAGGKDSAERASALFEELKSDGLRPDVRTYSALMKTFGKCGQPDEALALLDEMRAANVRPTAITYSSLMSALAKNGRHKEAIGIFHLMREEGVRGDAYVYTLAISAYGHMGLPNKAVGLLEDLRACQEESRRSLPLDRGDETAERRKEKDTEDLVAAFSAAITVCAKMGQTTKTVKLVRDMKASGLLDKVSWGSEVYLHTAAADAFSKAGLAPEAAEVVADMWRGGRCKPNVLTYTALIEAWGRVGRADKVVEVLREMEEKGVAPNEITYEVAVVACCSAGAFEQAEGIVQEKEDKEGDSGINEGHKRALFALVSGLSKTGQHTKSLHWFDHIRARGVLPDPVRFCCAVQSLWEERSSAEALSLVREMEGLWEAGKWAQRLQMEEGSGAAAVPPTVPPTAVTPGAAAQAEESEEGLSASASRLLFIDQGAHWAPQLQESTSRPMPPQKQGRVLPVQMQEEADNTSTGMIMASLFSVYAKTEQPDKVQRLLAIAREEGELLFPVLQYAITAFTDLGDIDAAQGLYREGLASGQFPNHWRSMSEGKRAVDFHHLHTSVASAALTHVIREEKVTGEVELVTGWGRHSSERGVSVLKPYIVSFMRETFGLEAREVKGNPGRIVTTIPSILPSTPRA